MEVRLDDRGWLLCAIADGTGSLPDSHIAAAHAVRIALTTVATHLGRTRIDALDWRAIFAWISHQLTIDCAGHLGLPQTAEAVLARAATTLVIAVLETKNLNGVRRVATSAVGDSSAWILRQGDWTGLAGSRLPTDPHERTLEDTRTAVLPATALPAQVNHDLVALEDGDNFFLFSDGISTPLGTGSGEVGRHLAAWWEQPPAILDFAAQCDFQRRSYMDDRSGIGVWVSGIRP
jgi:serine/threonine protein phosphatase PrpC